MAPKYVGSIDQGTSSTRFMLFDRDGRVVAREQREHKQIYPRAGWVEHDPMEIWENVRALITAAMRGVAPEDVAGIGITNQRETTIVWDRKTGKPLHNAIVWNCTRTDSIAERIAEAGGGRDKLRKKTGLPIVPYFSATKLVWLFENVPGLRIAAEKGDALFGTIDTWLIWNLTCGDSHITDVSNGCRTLLMNIHTLEWDAELLEIFNVPRAMLPTIVPSGARLALCDSHAAPELANVPISGILGDQQAATFGQVCFSPGMAKSTYGTGAFIMMNTGERAVPSKNGLLTTVGWQLGHSAKCGAPPCARLAACVHVSRPACTCAPRSSPALSVAALRARATTLALHPRSARAHRPVYCLEGGVAYAGAFVQWVRDNLKLIHDASETEAIARSVEDNGGVYFVPAFAGLFAPYWRSDARGTMCGLTAFNTSAHVVRAVLEAAAYQVKDVLDAMASDSGVVLHALRCDGGMTVNSFLMQFQADVLDANVSVPTISETTSVGAAYVAGLAVGFWPDLDSLTRHWSKANEWTPHMSPPQRIELCRRWKMAVERTLGWHSVERAPASSTERALKLGAIAMAIAASAFALGRATGRLL